MFRKRLFFAVAFLAFVVVSYRGLSGAVPVAAIFGGEAPSCRYFPGVPGVSTPLTLLRTEKICESRLTPGETERYGWIAPADGLYAVETYGNLDTILTVTVEGDRAVSDDNSGLGGNERICLSLQAGQKLFCTVCHASSRGRGNYSVMVRSQKAQILTFVYGNNGLDTSPDSEAPSYYLKQLGYDVQILKNGKKSQLLSSNSQGETLLNREVLFYSGHGQTDGRLLCLPNDEGISQQELGDLSHTTLAVWAACYSADGSQGISIAEASVRHGAQVALGWKGEISQEASRRYTDRLFAALYRGKSVEEAARWASKSFSPQEGVRQYCIFGDGSLCLVDAEVVKAQPLCTWEELLFWGRRWVETWKVFYLRTSPFRH